MKKISFLVIILTPLFFLVFDKIVFFIGCLDRQEEVYEIRYYWEGAPLKTRVPNQCELFAEKAQSSIILSLFGQSVDFPTVRAVAKNPHSSSNALDTIFHRYIPHDWLDVIFLEIAGNPGTSTTTLQVLSVHPRVEVAERSQTNLKNKK